MFSLFSCKNDFIELISDDIFCSVGVFIAWLSIEVFNSMLIRLEAGVGNSKVAVNLFLGYSETYLTVPKGEVVLIIRAIDVCIVF